MAPISRSYGKGYTRATSISLRTDTHGLARHGLDDQDEDQQTVTDDDGNEQAFGLTIFAQKQKTGQQD